MSINYQELVPEKALGKEISRHIFQTYRAKTGLTHEISLRYFIFNTASVLGDKIAAPHKKRIAVGDAPAAIRFFIRSRGPKALLQLDYLNSASKALVMACSISSASVPSRPSAVAVATNSPVSADTNWIVISFA